MADARHLQLEKGSLAASLRADNRAASVAFMLLGHLLRRIRFVSVMELWSTVEKSPACTWISVNGRGVSSAEQGEGRVRTRIGAFCSLAGLLSTLNDWLLRPKQHAVNFNLGSFQGNS